jgi:hypothetical protein
MRCEFPLTTYVCCVPSLRASSERIAWSATDEGGQVSGVAGPQLGLDSLSTLSPKKADRPWIPGNSYSLEIYPSLGCNPTPSPPHIPRLHAATKNLCQFGGLCGLEIKCKCEDYPTGLICWQQVCPIDVLCWSSQLTNYFFPNSWFEVFAGYNFHTH